MLRSGGRRQNVFSTQLRCYSMAMAGGGDKSSLNHGDKILLPPSALGAISQMEVEYPLLFELKFDLLGKKTHCGVSEFTAEEGHCHLPYFMMQNLGVEEGSMISVKNVTLPKATFLKVQAQSVEFLDISNPRAVLEVTLRKYTCVTVGDMIVLNHLGRLNYLQVLEVNPGGAASIVETDVSIDFAAPVGYVEPSYVKKVVPTVSAVGGVVGAEELLKNLQKARTTEEKDEDKPFVAFTGSGHRIDGKSSGKAPAFTSSAAAPASASAPTSVFTKAAAANPPQTTAGGGGALTIGGRPTAAPSNTPAPATAAPTHKSIIGDKFSTRRAAAGAFVGTGRKLA